MTKEPRDFGDLIEASASDGNLLVLFIPSADRRGCSLPAREQQRRVQNALKLLGRISGAAPHFLGLGRLAGRCTGRAAGLGQAGLDPVFTSETALLNAAALRHFMIDLGTQTRQGAVACVLNRTMYQIRFPLKDD